MFKSRFGKIFLGISLFFIIFYWLSYGVSYYLFSKIDTQKDGKIVTSISADSVQVVRTEFGVPHIYAKNEFDAFFTQGFITAQDRLWQLELYRLAVNAELSTILGKEARDADLMLKTLAFKKLGQELEKSVSDTTLKIIKAYTKGINAFIDFRKGNSGEDYIFPMEFALLNFEPKKWETSDVLGLTRLLGWELSIGAKYEILYGELFKKFGLKAVELYPENLKISDKDLPKSKTSFHSSLIYRGEKYLEKYLGFGSFGSNAWAISGKRTETGKPFLANDPHLPPETPSKWYEVGIFTDSIQIKGFAIPGIPCVLAGHNEIFAWGITLLKLDDADLTVLEMTNSKSYKFGEEVLPLEEEYSELKFRDIEEPEFFEIYKSKFGLIVTDVLGKDSSEVLALQWTGFDTNTDEIRGFYELNKSHNLESFRSALSKVEIPALNYTFADSSDNIGIQTAGRVPIRDYKILPFPVTSSDTTRVWKKFVEFEKLPFTLNPDTGFVANSNNPVFTSDGNYLTDFWEPNYRFERVTEVLASDTLVKTKSIKKLQTDFYSKHAEKTVKNLLGKEVVNLKDDYVKALSFLTNWDFVETPESVEAAIFHSFWFNLVENIFADEFLGENPTKSDTLLWHEFGRLGSQVTRVTEKIIENQYSNWTDDVTTNEQENTSKLVAKSLKESVDYLKQRLGKPLESWSWGAIHQVTHTHLIGQNDFLAKIYNIGPGNAGGSTATVNLFEYYFDNPFETTATSAFRQIIDFSDFNKSQSILATGQSGRRTSASDEGFLNPDYWNQSSYWIGGLYKTSVWDSTQVFGSAEHKLVLVKE
ncbi:MAG: penicillin acylase family protein [Calditrichaeota bacterium]|nr:MAG: penicillin acylase family protein [Calditrichota bacterium]